MESHSKEYHSMEVLENRYYGGTEVTIFYNPRAPQISTVRKAESFTNFSLIIKVILLGIFALVFMGISVYNILRY